MIGVIVTGCLTDDAGKSKVRNPFFANFQMLAKLTTKNQLTLPKAATAAVEQTDYFEVETRNGQIILTPVRLQRGDAVRAKLAELALTSADLDAAVKWARRRVAEPASIYSDAAGMRPKSVKRVTKPMRKTIQKPRR